MRPTLAAAAMIGLLLGSQGCLVVSLNPVYDEESIGFDPGLLGGWQDSDDNSSLQIDRGEWKSYRIHYVHPIENGDVTGYLTSIGDARYLDLMPASGVDRGSFLVPVHVSLRLTLDGDRLELAPLSYDWFTARLRARPGIPAAVPGLVFAFDQKENALIVSPTARLREWLRRQPAAGAMFGAAAVFTRK
ncbi:MAG: hypothetical protein ABI603_06085 [Acidobacteriota bacterium]